MTLLPDGSYHLAVGSTEMGNGSVTSHQQIAASVLGARADSVAIINADTDLTPYDTGTFASTGTVVAGQAVNLTANALRDNILDFASRHTGVAPADCRLDDGVVVCGNQQIALADLHVAGTKAGHRFEAKRKAYLSPRTVAFNVQGVRLAVHRVTARDPHSAQRPRRRHRPAHQSPAMPGPDRRFDRRWDSAGRSRRRWSTTAAPW